MPKLSHLTAYSIELLEDRIAPATIVNPTTITYQDADGDDVTIKLTKANVITAANLDSVLHFNTTADGSNATPQQLQTIDLVGLGTAATGLGITITAKRDALHGGDGTANVGYLEATGIDLGAISIAGDLGRVDAGSDSLRTPAIKSLTVLSMGVYGTSTQASGGLLSSNVHGAIPALTIHHDAVGILLTVTDASPATTDIGTLKIGGSLEGNGTANSGQITTESKIGSITIGGDLLGTAGNGSGSIVAGGPVGAVKIGGSVRGGDGTNSGDIQANGTNGTIKSITIGDNLAGGVGNLSGRLDASVSIGTVLINDSVLGGDGQQSGTIDSGLINGPSTAAAGMVKKVTIVGDLVGGNGEGSGAIGDLVDISSEASFANVGTVTVDGSVTGNAEASGTIAGATLGSITVFGSVIGGPTLGTEGDDEFSGAIFAPISIQFVEIGGSLIGHDDNTGTVSTATLGQMFIGHDLLGGEGVASGSINTSGLSQLLIDGSVRSGTGSLSGSITSSFIDGVPSGSIGSISIHGSVIGTASNPVQIFAEGTPGMATRALGSLTVGGSVTQLQVLGGYSGDGMGVENADATIGAIKVGGNWVASSVSAGVTAGTNGFGSSNDALGTMGLGSPNVSSIATITIGGQILGTVGGNDHFGFAAQAIGTIKIDSVTYPKLSATIPSLTLGSTGDVLAHLVS